MLTHIKQGIILKISVNIKKKPSWSAKNIVLFIHIGFKQCFSSFFFNSLILDSNDVLYFCFVLRRFLYLDCWSLFFNFIILCFFYSRKPHLSKSALCGSRWASKTSTIPYSYKRCTPWLELKTCCADLKLFVITLRPLRTLFYVA
jgi:hypothetical protein